MVMVEFTKLNQDVKDPEKKVEALAKENCNLKYSFQSLISALEEKLSIKIDPAKILGYA